MKKFSIPCDFGGQKANFDFYIGEPKDGNHPLQNQSAWLSKERGGSVPQSVMDSFAKLLKLAKENNVSFEELCVYAMDEAYKDLNANAGGGAQKPAAGAAGAPSGSPNPEGENSW